MLIKYGEITVPSAISRPFRMSRYALVDWNAMFDAINYQVSGMQV
jgi:hypothetical protein